MIGPVQSQVLLEFRRRLEASADVPNDLVEELVSLADRGHLPTNDDAFLRAIKAKLGGQPA